MWSDWLCPECNARTASIGDAIRHAKDTGHIAAVAVPPRRTHTIHDPNVRNPVVMEIPPTEPLCECGEPESEHIGNGFYCPQYTRQFRAARSPRSGGSQTR